jgi:hypothetical protein
MDVAGCSLRVDFPVIAAEGFEEGETIRNAGVVQKVIEGVFEQAGIEAAATEDFEDGGSLGFDSLLVECLERGDDRREIIKQAAIGV